MIGTKSKTYGESLDAIDPDKLPESVLIDSSVLLPALGRTRKTDDPQSRPLFDALIEHKRRILIAAPSAAEFYRCSSNGEIPRTPFVEIAAFDALAAELLGKKFPKDILVQFKGRTGAPMNYIKYDAMIVACAVRHRAAAFVSTDDQQRRMASAVGLIVKAPSDYTAKQTELYDDPQHRARKKKSKSKRG